MIKRVYNLALVGPTALICAGAVHAVDGWQIEPVIGTQFWHSDNIEQFSPGNEQSGSFLTLEPGVSIRREGPRLDVDFSYKLVNTWMTDDGDSDIRHRAALNANYEIYDQRFFVDVGADYSQHLVSAESDFGRDVVSRPDAFTDVLQLRLSPYWIERFDGYADMNARFDYEAVRYDEGRSDLDRLGFSIKLANGARYRDLIWEFYYETEKSQFSGADSNTGESRSDVTREAFSATLGYWLTDEWSVLGRAGYENSDDTQLDADDIPDGTFWSIGTRWSPSEALEATALYGPDDKEISIRYSPTERSNLEITWNDRDVGASTGSDWSARLSHRTRYSSWSAQYGEGLVVGGYRDLDGAFLNFDGLNGDSDDSGNWGGSVFDDQGTLDRISPSATLSDGDFKRKVFSAGVEYQKARTFAEALVFHETRDFADGDTEQSQGAAAKLTRRFGSRTAATIGVDWEKAELSATQNESVWDAHVMLSRSISRDFGAGIGYRYVQRASDEKGRDFKENRVGVLIRMQF